MKIWNSQKTSEFVLNLTSLSFMKAMSQTFNSTHQIFWYYTALSCHGESSIWHSQILTQQPSSTSSIPGHNRQVFQLLKALLMIKMKKVTKETNTGSHRVVNRQDGFMRNGNIWLTLWIAIRFLRCWENQKQSSQTEQAPGVCLLVARVFCETILVKLAIFSALF